MKEIKIRDEKIEVDDGIYALVYAIESLTTEIRRMNNG